MSEPRVTAAMAARGRALSEPRLSPDGTRLACVVRDAGGTRLVAVPSSGGPELVLTTDPAPAFRGGVYDWLPDGSALVYATGRGDLVLTPADGGPACILLEEAQAAGVAASPDGRHVAFVADLARVVVHDLATGAAEPRPRTADFCVDPAWSPDGRLAWHEWDVPHMPWDDSRIVVDGRPVAGGEGVAVQQPRWSSDGRLAYLSDRTGFLNLWLLDEPFEHGGPTWGPGQRTFAWSPDSRTIAFTRNEGGFGRLLLLDVATGAATERTKGVCTALDWRGESLACLRSGARTPTNVTVDGRVVLRGPVGGFEAADLPEPEVVHFAADDGTELHGRLYAPGADRPLLVWLHGGPTDQRRVEFDGRLAWFLDRGWAVLFPDYRGSTGWGRAYVQALAGRWGELDVADAAASVGAARAHGWGDPRRTVTMGASAGGFTVLRLMQEHPGLVAAGVALYPVVDLLDMAATTHRYEAHYTDTLVGLLPEAEDRYRARSPITGAARIVDPLLVLHGSDDVVVPAAQSAALAERVPQAEHHVYEGEGHGWSRPATTEDELERVAAFLDRNVLG
ncbi:MAG TPA: prolyl oligopeptidase family serine peptidase [Acidimicrobiales bacterium]|nr:prolyl oligopeptidase family serine peptidase [Acidimicrobiales bacterium]